MGKKKANTNFKYINNSQEGSKAFANTRTQYKIPTFTYKSAFMLIGFTTLGCLIVPFLLSELGFNDKIVGVLGGTFIAPLGIAISRCFIETKEGFGKTFFKLYAGFGAVLGFISVFWLLFENYI